MRQILTIGIVVVAVVFFGSIPVVASVPSHGAVGQFDGQLFNMAEGWGEATACWVGGELLARCFRTEADMDRWIAHHEVTDVTSSSTVLKSSCAGSLRLYDYTNHSGSVLYLSTRMEWLNLVNYGFDQRTSSFKIGSCSATFADLTHGGGDRYPSHLTDAYDQSLVMLSGWDNDVSSVRIS